MNWQSIAYFYIVVYYLFWSSKKKKKKFRLSTCTGLEWEKKFLCVNVDAVEPVYPQASKMTFLKSLSLDSLLNQTYFWSNFWSWLNLFLCNIILWFSSCIIVLCSLLFLHFLKVDVTSQNLPCVLVLVL